MGSTIDLTYHRWVKDCLDLDPEKYALEAEHTPYDYPARLQITITSDALVPVQCAGVTDLLAKASATMGGGGLLGVTAWNWGKADWKVDAKTKKVTGIVLPVSLGTRRAIGAGKWDTKNEEAIHEVEAANKKHEGKHRSQIRDQLEKTFDQTFMKTLIGKTKADAITALHRVQRDCNAAMEAQGAALDSAEGKTWVQANPDGTFTVTQIGI